VNEFIISNYKQTWASIGKLADAPEGVKQLSFKSLDYYGPLSPEERRKSRHLNIDTMGQRQNGMPMANLCSKGAPGPRDESPIASCMHSSRIVPVMAFFPVSAFNNVWEYPLFDALFGRRSRRFGLVSR